MRRGAVQAIMLGCGIWLGAMHLTGTATEPEPVRVALVLLEQGEVAQGVPDLATAKLSAEPGVEMLERQAIDAVLREQEWTLCGLVSAADAVRAGQILGADVLVVLQATAAAQPSVVTAFDAATGVRLVHDDLPDGDPVVQAECLSELCRQAIQKSRDPDKAIRTLSILAIQNVDLPNQQEYLVGALSHLLERRLIQSPGIAILERDRLEALNAERALAGGGTENDLRASVHVLELDISHGEKNGDIRIYIRLTDPAGALQGEFVKTGPANAPDLVNSIQNKLVRLLGMAPPPEAPTRAVEAQRYRREAEVQLKQKQYPSAIRAAEAAYALNPEDLDISRCITRCHFEYADTLYKEKGAQYLLQQLHWLDLLKSKYGDTSQVGFLGTFLNFRCPSTDPERHRGWSPMPNEVKYQELLRKLQNEYARQLGLSRTRTENAKSEDTPLIRTLEPRWAFGEIAMAAPDREKYLQYLSDYVHGWLADVQCQPDMNGDFRLSEVMRAMREITGAMSYDDHSWFIRDIPYYDGMRAVFMEMSVHQVPYMSRYGRLGVLYCDLKTEKISPAEALTQVRLIDEEVKARISKNAEREKNLRNLLYLFLLDLYDQVADLDERQLLYQGLFDFMLEQKALVPAVGHAATVPYAGYRRDGIIHNVQPLSTNYYPRLIHNAERYLEAIRNREQYFEYPTWEWIRRESETTSNALRTMREALGLPMGDHPWLKAIRVMDLKEAAPELTRIDQAYMEGDDLYILASTLGYVTNQEIVLFRTGRQGQSFHRIFHMAFDWHVLNPKRLGAICRYQENTYIPTYGAGVLVVSDNGSCHRLNKKSGLPSDQVQSVGILDGSLYVASGEEGKEAFINRYDVGTEQWTLLAAANRREKVGPLDQLPPYVIRGIYADPKRNRLVFVLDYEQYFLKQRIAGNEPDMPEIGLWSYCPESGSFKQIVPMNRSPLWSQTQGERLFTEPVNYCPYRDGEYNTCYGLVVFDYQKDRAGAVYYSEKRPAGPAFAVREAALYAPANIQAPPYVVQRDGIWFGRPAFGRHLFSGEIQFFPDAFQDKTQAERIDHLILADDGATLVAATDTQVWLFKRDPSVAMRDEDWEWFLCP